MGIDVIITLVSLVITKGPEVVLALQELFRGQNFTQDDLTKLAASVKDPASYFTSVA